MNADQVFRDLSSLPDAVRKRTRVEGSCLVWEGPIEYSNGGKQVYGNVWLDGKQRRANRVVWGILNDADRVPYLRQQCDTQLCIRHWAPKAEKPALARDVEEVRLLGLIDYAKTRLADLGRPIPSI